MMKMLPHAKLVASHCDVLAYHIAAKGADIAAVSHTRAHTPTHTHPTQAHTPPHKHTRAHTRAYNHTRATSTHSYIHTLHVVPFAYFMTEKKIFVELQNTVWLQDYSIIQTTLEQVFLKMANNGNINNNNSNNNNDNDINEQQNNV